jgi:hypothetical protein
MSAPVPEVPLDVDLETERVLQEVPRGCSRTKPDMIAARREMSTTFSGFAAGNTRVPC